MKVFWYLASSKALMKDDECSKQMLSKSVFVLEL